MQNTVVFISICINVTMNLPASNPSTITDVSFEAFVVVMIQVKIFWVVMPWNVVAGYQRFRGPCHFHLQDEVTEMGKNCIDIGLGWRGAAGALFQPGPISMPFFSSHFIPITSP
jgi:hypothetical protein